LYEKFGLPMDMDMASSLDCSFMHIHSAGGVCIPAVSEIPGLTGAEISNDPNGPPIETLVGWAKLLQSKGKSVVLSNWNRPLSDETIRYILGELDHSRLLISLQCTYPEQAEEYAAWFRSLAE
jgi:hypothetical protein